MHHFERGARLDASVATCPRDTVPARFTGHDVCVLESHLYCWGQRGSRLPRSVVRCAALHHDVAHILEHVRRQAPAQLDAVTTRARNEILQCDRRRRVDVEDADVVDRGLDQRAIPEVAGSKADPHPIGHGDEVRQAQLLLAPVMM